MLSFLQVRNLAIIEAIELELGPGFNVLTGETGAGKSILIDAIGLALGGRADGELIRTGCDQAEVTAEFTVDPLRHGSHAWLKEHDLVDDEEPTRCVIRRVVRASARSRSFVNDRSVSSAALQELGSQLIEVFGQGESRTLTLPETQRSLLDAYGVDPETLRATADAANRCQRLERRAMQLRSSGIRSTDHIDFLRFQLEELTALSLQPNEIETLNAEHSRLVHAERLLLEANQAKGRLYSDDQSIYDQVCSVHAMLESLAHLDSAFAPVLELTDGVQAQLRETADLIQNLLGRAEPDPQRLQDVEQRMAAVQDLARKHRVPASDLAAREAELVAEATKLEGEIRELGLLEDEIKQAREHYVQNATKLGRERRVVASQLEGAVTDNIRKLGMQDADFAIEIQSMDPQKPTAGGNDHIQFTFSANPGQPPQPLAKVASGGELSRIGLAIQVALRRVTATPTMIFDEIDAGVGGGVAEIVGERLRMLGDTSQVLCVTHLPQVAAKGQRHIHIAKEVQGGETFTRITLLSPAQRVTELARMSGGLTITAATEAHARELLQNASTKKTDAGQPSG